MISNKKEIKFFLHCKLCIQELNSLDDKTKLSPKEYSLTQTGYTKKGIQVWCNRHDCNIIHMDFEGVKHLANTTIAK